LRPNNAIKVEEVTKQYSDTVTVFNKQIDDILFNDYYEEQRKRADEEHDRRVGAETERDEIKRDAQHQIDAIRDQANRDTMEAQREIAEKERKLQEMSRMLQEMQCLLDEDAQRRAQEAVQHRIDEVVRAKEATENRVQMAVNELEKEANKPIQHRVKSDRDQVREKSIKRGIAKTLRNAVNPEGSQEASTSTPNGENFFLIMHIS
ncbi:hypothetical protein AMATHDRAFT_51340, partial [Amanita thiersii Skay4041]